MDIHITGFSCRSRQPLANVSVFGTAQLREAFVETPVVAFVIGHAGFREDALRRHEARDSSFRHLVPCDEEGRKLRKCHQFAIGQAIMNELRQAKPFSRGQPAKGQSSTLVAASGM
jgi:hypothetical protein